MGFKLENVNKEISNEKSEKKDSLDKFLKKEITLFGGGFNAKKKQSFFQELSVLLNAGVTLKEGLTLIGESQKKETDKKMFQGILNDVIYGNLFSEAIRKIKYFSEYEYYSLKIGEETGTIAQVCNELGRFYERKNEQQRIVIAALTYPSIVLTTALLVVVFMLSYVVPMFEDIFRQNNMELPWLTKVILKLSSFTKTYGAFFLIGIIVLLFFGKSLKNNIALKRKLHFLMLRMPIFGAFISKVYLAQFTQAVTLLISAKVPVLNSIQLVRKMIRFIPLQEALEKVEESILKGNSLSDSLRNNTIFDNRIISLVKVAEETNETEYVFKQLSDQYNQEVAQQSKIMSTVLEPFIIVIVGLLVAILLIAMYLPMFQLSSAIG